MVLALTEQVERLNCCVSNALDTTIKSLNVTLSLQSSKRNSQHLFVLSAENECLLYCHSPVSLYPNTKAALCDVTMGTEALSSPGCLANLFISTGLHSDKSKAPVVVLR